MKITIPLEALDIMGLLNAAADFHIRLCGSEDYLFAYLGTEKQRIERYDREVSEFYPNDFPFDRDAHLLHLRHDALLAGETIILPLASPQIDEPFPCIDGNEYTIDCEQWDDGENCWGEFISAVLMLRYRSDLGSVTISTGIEQESPLMTGVSFFERSLGSLDKPAENFVKRFIDDTEIKGAPVIELNEFVERFYSPYSGIVVDEDNPVNESDPSLLFTEFAGVGGYVSQRLIDHLGDIDEGTIISDEHIARITIPGAVVFRLDCGWDGIMLYGFAPP